MFAVRVGQLIDGNGGAPLRDAHVVVDGQRIVQVGPAASVPLQPGTALIDASQQTLMPGMIDCHVHVQNKGGMFLPSEALEHSQGFSTLQAFHNVQNELQMGFTSIRSLHSPGYEDVALRDAISAGLVEGPRIRACGQGISVTGGHMDKGTWAPEVSIFGKTNVGDGPWACRRAVREQLKRGADVIKINASGGANANLDEPWHQEMTYEEMAAVCEEAHWAKKRVASHTSGGPSITDAIRAGLDSIEHSVWLTEEQADMMAEHNVFYIPTFLVNTRGIQLGREVTRSTEGGWRWLQKVCEDRWPMMERVRKAGAKIAVGTDAGFWVNHGENAGELAELVKGGFSPMEAIVAATRTGAECLDLDQVTGTIAAGKLADLVLVDGDPLADITILQRKEKIAHVWKEGKQVK